MLARRGGSVSKCHTFSGGVTIRDIQPILWELAAAKKLMSDDDRDYLSKPRYWLSVSKDVQDWRLDQSDDLYQKAHRAMYALQISCPSGSRNEY
jgi:hypothetical protein